MLRFFLTADNETTRSLISGAAKLLLCENPAQKQLLLEKPALFINGD
jgi:cytochrome P450